MAMASDFFQLPLKSSRTCLITSISCCPLQCFHLCKERARDVLGLDAMQFKRACKQAGIARWPHRKVASLLKLRDELLAKEQLTAEVQVGGENWGRRPGCLTRPVGDSASIPPCPDTTIIFCRRHWNTSNRTWHA